VNTHRAVVECTFPPGVTPIASGSKEHCQAALIAWTEAHPTPQWSSAYVMQVVTEVICEPGVGVYAVPIDSGFRNQGRSIDA
jgi:hypothetical protein